tara:strand:- start:3507 stop:4058 length:552 start_codon:yes stop_codon:yes gene_type:complete
MSSGIYVDLNNLRPEDMNMTDVDTALNGIIRFTGHYADVKPLTVAQHTLLCLTMAEMFEPEETDLHEAILIHDFSEAYIGDVATPVKQAMGDAWYKFAKPIEQMVEVAFYGSLMDPEMHDRVKLYDLASLDIERRVMWASQYGKDKWPPSPLSVGTIEDKRELFNMAVSNDNVGLQTIWRSFL